MAPKLSYIPSSYQVRLELTTEVCQSGTETIGDLVDRAKGKMEALKTEEKIVTYRLNSERVHLAWMELGRRGEKGKSTSFILATGIPSADGVKVEVSKDPKVACVLSLSREVDFKEFQVEWLRSLVEIELEKKHGKKVLINYGHIEAALLKAQNGEEVAKYTVGLKPKLSPEGEAKPFVVLMSKTRREVTVVVNDPCCFEGQFDWQKFWNTIIIAAKKLVSDDCTPKVLKDSFTRRVKALLSGPERYKIQGPFSALAVVGFRKFSNPFASGKLTFEEALEKGIVKLDHSCMNDKIKIAVTPDRLAAEIEYASDDIYAEKESWKNLLEIESEIKKMGIRSGIHPGLGKVLYDAVAKRKNFTGIYCCQRAAPDSRAKSVSSCNLC